MKINIKDVLEKDKKDVHVQTNDRLDIEEVFAEAAKEVAEDGEEKKEPEPDAEADAESEAETEQESEPGAKPEADAESGAEPETESASDVGPEIDAEPEAATEKAAEETHDENAEDAADKAGDAAEENVKAESEDEPEAAAEVTASDEPEPMTDDSEAEQEPEGDAESAEETVTRAADESDESNGAEEADEAAETAAETETPAAEEAAAAAKQAEEKQPFYRRYLTQGAIGAAFVILLAVIVVYTTMIPREVNATINGEEFKFSTKAYTVERFLEDENIEFGGRDYISTPLTAFIYDGMELEIKHATDFKVTADGKTKAYESLENTVGEALADVGVKVGENDIVTPKADSMLEKDMEIIVQRVTIKEEVVEEKVKFKTEKKDDSSIDEGSTKVVTRGSDGKDRVTYRVTYVDGKEKSRKEIGRETITKVVNEVIAVGTRINYNGQTYSRKLVVKAYAYTGGGTTAMGTRARVGEIAVDPSVIPLGTNVYIEGVGPRRAEDTGGNIQGNTIDIYMNSESECRNWGVRYVTIYIQ